MPRPPDLVRDRIRELMECRESYYSPHTIGALIHAYTTKDPRFCNPYRTESLLVNGNEVMGTLPEGEERIPDHLDQMVKETGGHLWTEEVTSLWIHQCQSTTRRF